MYINYHYFAVKTLCIEAGFQEEDAQCIAAYSQFVDDYNVWINYHFKKVPAFAMGLAKKSCWGGYDFYTVTTGFTSDEDYARLILSRYQREIVVPFHFIPIKKLKDLPKNADRSKYRTAPADIEGTFLIKNLLDIARNKYIQDHKKQDLIRIGSLLHTFADTYAHQMFSGFRGWENYSYLKKATNVFDGDKDITKTFEPNKYEYYPSIGHVNLYSAPDMTYASWEMSMAENGSQNNKSKYKLQYSRSNVSVFCKASEQILKYLCSCLGKPMVSPEQWEVIKKKLVDGFDTLSNDASELSRHWNAITGYTYHYNKDDLWKNQLKADANEPLKETPATESFIAPDGTEIMDKSWVGVYETASDDFFWYNVIAKETRDAVLN